MSEVSEVVPKIIEKVFSTEPDLFKNLDVTIKPLENSRSFWSECYQILVTSKSDEYKDKVVSPLFVKIPRISPINAALDAENAEENTAILRTLTAQEVTFYKDFCEFSFPCFPIPRFFYGESFENEPMAGIVCEDFSGIGASIDFVPGFSDRQVTQLMEALAGFHSEIIRRTAEIPWQNYGNALYDACYIRMLFTDTLQFEDICPQELSGRIQAVKHVFDEQGVQNSNDLNSQLGLPFVLCHNDLNASNVLWNKSTGQIQAVIDFQHISKGPVTFDIIRILCLGLSVEDRKRNTDKYLRHYFESLKSYLSPVPFTLDQLFQSYSVHFDFVNATSLFSLSYYYKMYKEKSLDIKDSPEVREEKAAEILRRTIGILDDMKK